MADITTETGSEMVRVDYLIGRVDELIKVCEYEIADLRTKISDLHTRIEYNKGKIVAYENIKSEI